jgi:sugar phosphate isomerase/epimerase
MEVGILAHTFYRPDLGSMLDAVVAAGLKAVQYHIFIDGKEVLPESYTDPFCAQIADAFQSRGVAISAISGLFNMIHPDITKRGQGTRLCRLLIEQCGKLGARFMTMCSGTRNTDCMWTFHPDNADPSAWRDLLHTLERLVPVAEQHGVLLGIEPEQANVITTAVQARRLFDEVRSPNVKLIMDGANLFRPSDLSNMKGILTEAFDLLGEDIGLAHAKDIIAEGDNKEHPAAGTGLLDWDTYLTLLKQSPYDGPIILHNLSESQVPKCVGFIQDHLAE